MPTPFSRDLADADPSVAAAVRATQDEFARRFAPWFLLITCVGRTSLAQDALWLQGRTDMKTLNAARARAGLPAITDAREAARKVTWTRHTRHEMRPKSDAVDLAVAIDPDGPLGPLKPVIEWDDIPRYEAMGQIAEAHGLTWGGRWKDPDFCHVEKARRT